MDDILIPKGFERECPLTTKAFMARKFVCQ
jgi:hypothetical protein